ncbi:MAG: hypothetical protein D6681_07075 [Calditrichaeota bacterium]|nr:MAG: hypothetical protein D6681_07075 [Calditrichota bacterium]
MGNPQEFSVPVRTPALGRIFLNALRSIGVPDESIVFEWRQSTTLPKQWDPSHKFVKFSRTKGKGPMRLKVRAFSIGHLKIISRCLAGSFYSIGERLIIYVSNPDFS